MKAKESNEINNKELKENIANTALSLLEEGSDYVDLEYTTVQFGYLFDMIKGYCFEAFLKVVTDKTTAYFAVQGTSMMRLNFSDELFETTVAGFLDLHS